MKTSIMPSRWVFFNTTNKQTNKHLVVYIEAFICFEAQLRSTQQIHIFATFVQSTALGN